MAKRRRKHRKNSSSMPVWFWPALVGTSLVSIFLWKKANPTTSLNPMPPSPAPV